jgi:hypothetical protein
MLEASELQLLDSDTTNDSRIIATYSYKAFEEEKIVSIKNCKHNDWTLKFKYYYAYLLGKKIDYCANIILP